MNDLPKTIETGTFGEIFVQLKLLQFGVQAAPPIKDTGNDLIAIKKDCYSAIQVKSTFNGFPIKFDKIELPERYHLLALVSFDHVKYDDETFQLSLDNGRIFLIPKGDVSKGYWQEKELLLYELSKDLINKYFQ